LAILTPLWLSQSIAFNRLNVSDTGRPRSSALNTLAT